MTTGVLFCCWPLLTVMETDQRRNYLLRVPSTPVVRTYRGACQVCIESRPAIPSNAVQPKGFKFWLECTSFPVFLCNHQWEPTYQRYVSSQLSVTWQFGNWKQGFLEVFALITCIARSLNYFLPKTPIARQTFKLLKLSYNLICVWPCIIIVGKVI